MVGHATDAVSSDATRVASSTRNAILISYFFSAGSVVL
jgi:hypothetical protein